MIVILNNNDIKENSFVYDLKYKNFFNEVYFVELLGDFIESIINCDVINKEKVLLIMFNIYGYLNVNIISHFNNQDLSSIINYSNDIFLYNERLRELIKIYIKNDINALKYYEDDLGKLGIE